MDWQCLVDLWYALNAQLGRVVEGTPGTELDRPRLPHSLHRIAWRTWPESQPVHLGDLIEDYLGHMEHHLEILFRQAPGIDVVGQDAR